MVHPDQLKFIYWDAVSYLALSVQRVWFTATSWNSFAALFEMQQAKWQYLCREFGSPQPAEIHLLLSLRCSNVLGNISAESLVHRNQLKFICCSL
jgi:hypothetical protein